MRRESLVTIIGVIVLSLLAFVIIVMPLARLIVEKLRKRPFGRKIRD